MKLEEKYLKRIEEECSVPNGEPENHINADIILTDLLKELGYDELVNKYNSIRKWYE